MRIKSVLKKLKDLKDDLNTSVDRLWSQRLALAQAYRQGHQDQDFLPRRLKGLSEKEQVKFESLLHQVNGVIAEQLDNPFFVLNSDHDLKSWLEIRKTIRYIRNSFSNDYPVSNTLVKLNRALPSSSLK